MVSVISLLRQDMCELHMFNVVSLGTRLIFNIVHLYITCIQCTFHLHVHAPIASTHQPSLLYSGGQSVSTGIHVSPPSQMDTGGYLPPFLLGSPAAKSVSYQELFIPLEMLIYMCMYMCVLHVPVAITKLSLSLSLSHSLLISLSLSLSLLSTPSVLS